MTKPIDQSFFKEDWEKREDETPTQEFSTASFRPERDAMSERALAAYDEMKKGSEKNETLHELFIDTQQAIARYLYVMADLNEIQSRGARGEMISRHEIGRADQSRRTAHDALIDNINILSRAFVKFGLDNNWRKVLGLETREQVTSWAIYVGSTVAADIAHRAHAGQEAEKGGKR